MNPSVDASILSAAYEADEAAASAEYGAEFRREIEAKGSMELGKLLRSDSSFATLSLRYGDGRDAAHPD